MHLVGRVGADGVRLAANFVQIKGVPSSLNTDATEGRDPLDWAGLIGLG